MKTQISVAVKLTLWRKMKFKKMSAGTKQKNVMGTKQTNTQKKEAPVLVSPVKHTERIHTWLSPILVTQL